MEQTHSRRLEQDGAGRPRSLTEQRSSLCAIHPLFCSTQLLQVCLIRSSRPHLPFKHLREQRLYLTLMLSVQTRAGDGGGRRFSCSGYPLKSSLRYTKMQPGLVSNAGGVIAQTHR